MPIRLLAVFLAFCLTAGCKAQPSTSALNSADYNRRVEIMVRTRFSLTPDIDVTLGARKPSNIPGYETLPVTLTRGGRTQTIDFLISTDGKTLGRFDTFDISKDPLASIQLAGRPVRGNPNAKVTVINYDDLECPYCSRMHRTLFPATINRYKDKVRFIYKDFPLLEIHPWAMHAAIDADCLNAQSNDAYWSFVDYVHAHGDEVNGENRDVQKSFAALDRLAREQATAHKLDTVKLGACLTAQDETPVKSSLKEAMDLGLDGAPALFINGERIVGALPEEMLWKAIDRALRSVGEEPPPAQNPGQPVQKEQ